jgi:Holliday junction DNA helicase RuvB
LIGIEISEDAIIELGSRSRGTPRVANRLLRRVRDYAQVHANGSVELTAAQKALEMYEVDQVGLDRLDKSVLSAIVEKFNGGPVGLSTLAMAIGEEAETIENLAEPFLVRMGFISRTPRGRVATAAGFTHLGQKPPIHLVSLFDTPASDA